MNAQECFEAGKLQEAIDAIIAEVKSKPTNIEKRALLCDLLCYAGDLERADKQLDTITLQTPDAVMGISLIRQLIRGEQARRDFYENGRVPEFMGEPTPMQKLQLQACIEWREGKAAESLKFLEEAEELRTPCHGVCDGARFEEFRDLDDLASASLEVYTPNGKYYWIPVDQLVSLTLRAPEFPRDLMWRGARMVLRDGTEGEVFLPALYYGSHEAEDNQLKLGRATDWRGDESEPVRGIGQKIFLVGEEDKPVLSLTDLQFEAAK